MLSSEKKKCKNHRRMSEKKSTRRRKKREKYYLFSASLNANTRFWLLLLSISRMNEIVFSLFCFSTVAHNHKTRGTIFPNDKSDFRRKRRSKKSTVKTCAVSFLSSCFAFVAYFLLGFRRYRSLKLSNEIQMRIGETTETNRIAMWFFSFVFVVVGVIEA